jgi:hypothetical protein
VEANINGVSPRKLNLAQAKPLVSVGATQGFYLRTLPTEAEKNGGQRVNFCNKGEVAATNDNILVSHAAFKLMQYIENKRLFL